MRPTDFDDDDGRVGLARGKAPAPPTPLPPEEADYPGVREGDFGLGKAPQRPVTLAAHSDADRRAIRLAEEAEARDELARAEEFLAADPAVFRWLGWFAHPLAGAFLLGTVGVLGLFLYSQTFTILANIATQPLWAQYFGYGGLALLAGCVVFAMLRLALVYARLQRNRQIRLDGLEELNARTRLRWLVNAKVTEARGQLTRYVAAYPLEKPAKLISLGLTPEVAGRLTAARVELTDADKFGGSPVWFERFYAGFQTPLDELAEARVRYWSNRAMVVTALSPNGLVDTLATGYFGFAMLTDLCRVYNLRAGRTGTAVLLGRVFFNAYLAGQLNDVESVIEGQADHVFEQGLQVVGVGVGAGAASKILGKVGAKATTGYLNRLLLMRLGRYTCRLLRPMAQPTAA